MTGIHFAPHHCNGDDWEDLRSQSGKLLARFHLRRGVIQFYRNRELTEIDLRDKLRKDEEHRNGAAIDGS